MKKRSLNATDVYRARSAAPVRGDEVTVSCPQCGHQFDPAQKAETAEQASSAPRVFGSPDSDWHNEQARVRRETKAREDAAHQAQIAEAARRARSSKSKPKARSFAEIAARYYGPGDAAGEVVIAASNRGER